jgi:hypothetical protein
VTLQFNRALDSPFLAFRVTAESGIPCYSMQTVPGQAWRSFEPGDTAEVEVAFRARLGGGTYRLSLSIADRNASNVLGSNLGEIAIYLAPRPGSMGHAGLEATISAFGRELSDHGEMLLQPRTTAVQSAINSHA